MSVLAKSEAVQPTECRNEHENSPHRLTQPGYNAGCLRISLWEVLLHRFFLLLWVPCVWGQAAEPDIAVPGWGSCAVPAPLVAPGETVPEGELEVVSGKVAFQLDGDASFSDSIILRSGNRSLRADGASYKADSGVFSVEGEVEYRDPETLVTATAAEFDQTTGIVNFEGARFQVWAVPARGEAKTIRVERERKLRMTDVAYTSCPEGNNDWMLRADKIRVDQEAGIGTARNARLEFKGIPLLYFPYISYPATNQRKSGWLIPQLGTSEQRGIDLVFPYYWNIAPQFDATITPRYMSERGPQLQGEFRYLTTRHNGVFDFEHLNDDEKTGTNRSLLSLFHQTQISRAWRGTADAIEVSDAQYFEDLSGSLASSSQTHLERKLDFEYVNRQWNALLRFQDYQTIDDLILPEDEPYLKLPQFLLRGYSPRGLFGLKYGFEADMTYFDRSIGVTGLRTHLMPEIARPFRFRLFDVEPSIGLDHTRYSLRKQTTVASSTPTRTAPVLSLDFRTAFERTTKRRQWIQTLEPRILYTYIPFRNQDQLPVFDTIEPDLNIVQLFRENRFVGPDRLGDANQLSVGLTTRIIDPTDGDEFLNVTIGQIRYFQSLDVTLPGELKRDDNGSDYLAEVGTRLYDNWNIKVGWQWNSDTNQTVKSEARVQYVSGESKLASLSYRFRRDALEEIDFSLAWPLTDSWSMVGRYNYSILGSEPLERFVGFEYSSCCWGISAVWRRNLTRRTGESDTSISVQLLLKGFSSTGKPTDSFLERGILGYD